MGPATTSSSPKWSTTPIWCHGRSCARRTGATLRWYEVTPDGRIDLSKLDDLINERIKVVAFSSPVQCAGTVNPVETLVRRAEEVGALAVLDACQSVPHSPVDFARARCGLRRVLRAQDARSERDRRAVRASGTVERHAAVPHRWVDDRDGAHGGDHLRAAATAVRGRYADDVPGRSDWPRPRATWARSAWIGIVEHEVELAAAALEGLPLVPGVRIVGPQDTSIERGSPVAFVVDGVHAARCRPGTRRRGVAVRVGHHCAWPLHRGSASPPRHGRRSPCTTHSTRWTAGGRCACSAPAVLRGRAESR